ncbi:MAG TPA: alanine racemase [Candidatus Paceibacterota bacterium]|nr:alanine racemase [Candidatus Paceibacterota bacterium]
MPNAKHWRTWYDRAMELGKKYRTWIEIDRAAIKKNFTTLRRRIPKKTKFMAVVKSNAYGHGFVEYAREMERLGADWLGVDSITEALALRREGLKVPILVLGYTIPSYYRDAAKYHISLTISSADSLAHLRRLKLSGEKLRIHLKIDTGMHRQGFQITERDMVVDALAKLPAAVQIEGLYTHFAEAKNPLIGHTTRKQIAFFEDWRVLLSERGYRLLSHAGATGGAMLYPEAHYDMVRIGIGIYGLWPSEEARRTLERVFKLTPVLTWKAIIGEVKRVPFGEKVGYDYTETLQRDTTLAVIPVGYWHGVPRVLSSKGRVLVRGKSARIVGRVSMDMIVVDVTDIPKVAAGEEVVLIGASGKLRITPKEIADLAMTSHYEIVTGLNPLIYKHFR